MQLRHTVNENVNVFCTHLATFVVHPLFTPRSPLSFTFLNTKKRATVWPPSFLFVEIIRAKLPQCNVLFLKTGLDGFGLLFVTRFFEKREHILLVCFYTRLVERIYSENVCADSAGELKEVEQ